MVTLAVLNELKLMLVSPVQPENMLVMLVTFEVFNFDKSRLVSAEQFKNILCIVLETDVFIIKESSDTLARCVQPENISSKFATFCISQLFILTCVTPEFLNIAFVVATFGVRHSLVLTLARLVQL